MILELLRKVTIALEENGISYMLSGSLAMNVYSIPRMTRDIDIVVHLDKSDIDKILKIFKNGYYFNLFRFNSPGLASIYGGKFENGWFSSNQKTIFR